jgi:hypothetical protein
MDLKNYPRQNYEIQQFTKARCYELEGEKFRFIMNGGYDYDLEFTGKTTCLWNIVGDKHEEAVYECLKADDTTYMVTFLVKGAEPDICHTYVIDLEQKLVTQLISTPGMNPRFPMVISNKYDFGAILVEGHPLPFKRHCFTDELLGTRVEWHWTTKLVSRHAYDSTNFYRITWAEGSTLDIEFSAENEKLPSTDEVAQYIKIKDHMYMFVVTEEMAERLLGDDQPFRSNTLVMIQNYDRMYHVGRGFGAMMVNGKPERLTCLFGAFGNPVELPSKFLNAPNPYTV